MFLKCSTLKTILRLTKIMSPEFSCMYFSLKWDVLVPCSKLPLRVSVENLNPLAVETKNVVALKIQQ